MQVKGLASIAGTRTLPNDGLTRLSAGSGFVYDERGYILTNAHVVGALPRCRPDSKPSSSGPTTSTTSSAAPHSRAGALLPPIVQPVLHQARQASAGAANVNGAGSSRHQPLQLKVTLNDGRILDGTVVAIDQVATAAAYISSAQLLLLMRHATLCANYIHCMKWPGSNFWQLVCSSSRAIVGGSTSSIPSCVLAVPILECLRRHTLQCFFVLFCRQALDVSVSGGGVCSLCLPLPPVWPMHGCGLNSLTIQMQ